MKNVIHWKSTILSIINFLSVYLLSKGIIGIDEATLISGVLATFGFSVNAIMNKSKGESS